MSSTTTQLKIKCLKAIRNKYPAFNNTIYNDYDWFYDYDTNSISIPKKYNSGSIIILESYSGLHPMTTLESIVDDVKINRLLGISFEDYYEGLVNE